MNLKRPSEFQGPGSCRIEEPFISNKFPDGHLFYDWTAALMDLLDAVVAARKAGATDAQLQAVFALQRKAQWRLDFVAAENSMGFHAPQETARVLAEAIDYARQGQLAVRPLAVAQAQSSSPRQAAPQTSR